MVNLVELDLSNNFLTKVPMAALAALKNMKFLNLGSNKIQVMVIIVLPRLQFSRHNGKHMGWVFSHATLSTILCHKTRLEVFSFCRPPVPGAVSPAHHLADRPSLDHWSSGLPIKLPHPSAQNPTHSVILPPAPEIQDAKWEIHPLCSRDDGSKFP